jgi:hypothetical protein
MPLSEEQKRTMTLGEFEELASRFSAALGVFKEAQSLLGAPVETRQPAVPAPPPRPPSRLDPEAQAELDAFHRSAERQRLIAQNREDPSNFPPVIANAMRGT